MPSMRSSMCSKDQSQNLSDVCADKCVSELEAREIDGCSVKIGMQV